MNKVILARPNNLIVREMKKFISRNQLEPIPVEVLSQMNAIPPAEINGIVISTAVASNVEESYSYVFEQAYQRFPKVPTVFATLADVNFIAESLKKELTPILGRTPDILSISDKTENIPESVSKHTILVLHKYALNHPTISPKLDRLIAHFFNIKPLTV